MVIKIYVVIGSTGEYSDRYEWVVKAFTDEDSAQWFVNEASAIARREFNKAKKKGSFWDYEGKHELDPNFSMDYTGTNYCYEETSLEGLPHYG